MVERIHEPSDESNNLIEKNKAALAKCENVIQKGESAFMLAARAVFRIVEGSLFKGLYPTKTAYFADRWDMGKQELQNYEHAGQVLAVFEEGQYEANKLPTNGGQCKELYRQSQVNGLFNEQRMVEIWSKVLESKKKVTAKLIAELAADKKPQSEVVADTEQEQPITVTSTHRELGSPAAEEPTTEATKCSAMVVVKLDSTVLQDALEYQGKVCTALGDGEYEFEVVEKDIEALMHHLGAWAKAYSVKRFIIRLS